MIDIVIFAVIAAILVFKLWSKLGKSTDDDINFMGGSFSADKKPAKPTRSPNIKASAVEDVVFSEVPNEEPVPDYSAYGEVSESLQAIKSVDSSFDPKDFLQGAEAAFEVILGYFAEGDKNGLKKLLGADIYKNFATAIDDRKTKGQILTGTLIGIDKINITDARYHEKKAIITVSIHSQQVQTLFDKDGSLLEGDEQQSQTKIDIWVFERKLKSKDPNWLLMATDS